MDAQFALFINAGLVGDGHAVPDGVDVLGIQLEELLTPVGDDEELAVHAQLLGEHPGKLGVEAGPLAVLVLVVHRLVVGNTDDKLSVLLDVLRVGFRGFAAAAGQKRQHHDNGQNPCNALFHILFFLSELASG